MSNTVNVRLRIGSAFSMVSRDREITTFRGGRDSVLVAPLASFTEFLYLTYFFTLSSLCTADRRKGKERAAFPTSHVICTTAIVLASSQRVVAATGKFCLSLPWVRVVWRASSPSTTCTIS